jgi:catechol-2,3-dioxygenase
MGMPADRLPIGGFARLLPELDVFDLKTSKTFWYKILGIQIAYQWPESRFLYLGLRGAQVMLKQKNGNWETATTVRILGTK